MEKKTKLSEILRLHLRAMRDINRTVPGRVPCHVLLCVMETLTPYLTIWLSAQLINELATARRAEVLTRWAVLTVLAIAVLGLCKALLEQKP